MMKEQGHVLFLVLMSSCTCFDCGLCKQDQCLYRVSESGSAEILIKKEELVALGGKERRKQIRDFVCGSRLILMYVNR